MEDLAQITENKTYTIEDVMALPDGQRAELIDGHWYDMATPSRIHQEIVMAIAYELRSYVRKKGGDCRVYPAPFAVFLNKDNRNYLEPDIVVVCDPGKLSDRGCEGAPDLVVEVVSPSTSRRDYAIKLFKYRTAGVREYWIINPETKTINSYLFSAEGEDSEQADQISFDGKLVSGIYPDFEVTLAELL